MGGVGACVCICVCVFVRLGEARRKIDTTASELSPHAGLLFSALLLYRLLRVSDMLLYCLLRLSDAQNFLFTFPRETSSALATSAESPPVPPSEDAM